MAETVEFVVKDSLQKTMLETAVVLEALKQKTTGFNLASAEGMRQVENAATKTADSLRKMTAQFNEAGKSASNLTRLLGAAGLATAFYGLARGLENMSVGALNLHYTARELGMSGRAFSRLQELYERLGFSSAEAGQKVAQTANILRDLGQKGPASDYYKQLREMGAGGAQLAAELTKLARSGGGVEEAFMAVARIMPMLNEYQRRQLAAVLGAPERLADFERALARLTGRYLTNTDAAWDFHQAWMDLGIQLDNFKLKIGATLIEQLNKLHDTLKDRGSIQAFENWLKEIDIEKLAERIEAIANAIDRILGKLGQFVDWVNEKWKLAQVAPEEELRRLPSGPVAPIQQGPPTARFAPTPEQMQDIHSGLSYGSGDQRPIILPPVTTGALGGVRELLELENQSNAILGSIRDAIVGHAGGGMAGAGQGGTGQGGADQGGTGQNLGAIEKYFSGGQDTTGRMTWFNPKPYQFVDPKTGISWLDQGALRNREGAHASGLPITAPGIATAGRGGLGGYYSVTLPDGRVVITQKTDVGPRGVVDLNAALAAQAYPGGPRTVPSGSRISAKYLGRNLPPGVAAGIYPQGTTIESLRQQSRSMRPTSFNERFDDGRSRAILDSALAAERAAITGNVNIDIAPRAKPTVSGQNNDVFLPVPNTGTGQMPIPYGIEERRTYYE